MHFSSSSPHFLPLSSSFLWYLLDIGSLLISFFLSGRSVCPCWLCLSVFFCFSHVVLSLWFQVLLSSCHFLQWTAMPFHFPLLLHIHPAVFFSSLFLPFSFCLTEATWRTSLGHSSLSARKPHPSFCGRGRGYDSHFDVHVLHSYMYTHTHKIHSPSISPNLLSTFHFPPAGCQTEPTTFKMWYVVGFGLKLSNEKTFIFSCSKLKASS